MLQSVELWALLLTKQSDKAAMGTAPWRAVLVEWIGADLGIKTCFPVVITKATDPCSLLCKAKQAKVICGNSTWSIYFVICSDKKPIWRRFSWRYLLMGLSDTRLWSGAGNGSLEPLKFFSEVVGMDAFLSALPAPLPKHCLRSSSMSQSGALSLELWVSSSVVFLSCVFFDSFWSGLYRVTPSQYGFTEMSLSWTKQLS